MKKEKMLWNKGKTSSVRASRIREITIVQSPSPWKGWEVKGWFNSNEYFYFGLFDTKEEAMEFVEALHQKIEES